MAGRGNTIQSSPAVGANTNDAKGRAVKTDHGVNVGQNAEGGQGVLAGGAGSALSAVTAVLRAGRALAGAGVDAPEVAGQHKATTGTVAQATHGKGLAAARAAKAVTAMRASLESIFD